MVLVFICAEFDIWLENITLINQIEFAQKFSPISFSVSSLHVFFSSFSILGNKTRLDEGQDFILRRCCCCCSAYYKSAELFIRVCKSINSFINIMWDFANRRLFYHKLLCGFERKTYLWIFNWTDERALVPWETHLIMNLIWITWWSRVQKRFFNDRKEFSLSSKI